MVTVLIVLSVVAIGVIAESIHVWRCWRLGPLAFGPKRRPPLWVLATPAVRITSLAAVAWGLATLMQIEPRVHRITQTGIEEPKHIVMVLDVSPSMRLQDAGPSQQQSRIRRTSEVMESFFKRVPLEQYRITVVAVYTGAKPVVEDTRDIEVVRWILDDLPMHYAFESGETNLFSGLEEAARIARPWNPNSTTIVLLTDGDTVPASGMPKMPASVKDVVVVGVGDPRTGKFINGRQSRQEASVLRQIAKRLGGTYHNGNEHHLSSALLARLTHAAKENPWDNLTLREYALIACAAGATIFAGLPVLLHFLGTFWLPGVRTRRLHSVSSTIGTDRIRAPDGAIWLSSSRAK